MREPTLAERLEHRGGLTLDELDALGQGPVRRSIQRESPRTVEVFVQVEWKGDTGVIRAFDPVRGEILADFGIGRCYWLFPNQVTPTQVRYTPAVAL